MSYTNISIFNKKATIKTTEKEFNVHDYLREHLSDYRDYEDGVLLHKFEIDGDPVYRYGEEPRKITGRAKYSPLEKIACGVYKKTLGELTTSFKYEIKSGKKKLATKESLLERIN